MQKKKVVHYCNSETDACKMQGGVPVSSLFQFCKHIYTNKFIMITFPENSHLCDWEVYVKHIHL